MSPEAKPPLLACEELTFRRGQRLLLQQISLAFHPGEVVALLGPNGAGKSTLLRLLLGLEPSDTGQITIAGEPLAQLSRRQLASHIAYVPQSHVSPFPYLVQQVVAMGRFASTGLFGRPSQQDSQLVEQQLQRLQIAHLAQRPYTEISGGERQLVLLARALVQGASLLLLDEPASALDFGHQARLLLQLRQLADDGLGVVMTTHHPHHARMIADRALLLRDGKLLQQGTPEQVLNREAMQALYDINEAELSAFARAGWEL